MLLEELSRFPIDRTGPDTLLKSSQRKETLQLRELLTALLYYVENHAHREPQRQAPSQSLAGTYEEMHSNWRNKVEEAAENTDSLSVFVNLCSFQNMLEELSAEFEIGKHSILEDYDPDSLQQNVAIDDSVHKSYKRVYHAAGITVKRYEDVDSFTGAYLKEISL